MWFSGIRALHHTPNISGASAAPRHRPSMRTLFATAAAATSAAQAGSSGWMAKATSGLIFGGGLALGAGASAAWCQDKVLKERQLLAASSREANLSNNSNGQQQEFTDLAWFNELAGQSGVRESLSAGQMFRQHPVTRLVVEHDHLFDELLASGQIQDMRCFYDAKELKFHCIVRLGQKVCGYPQTVHGGLTATIVDESFGGLSLSLWQNGKLGVQAPGYTARLEVNYKQKVPHNSVILCTCEVEKKEDRKLWMHATVSDGAGLVYSDARALFVAPRIRNILFGWLPFIGKGGSGSKPGSGGNSGGSSKGKSER